MSSPRSRSFRDSHQKLLQNMTVSLDYGTAFLHTYTDSGLSWVQTVGCIYIIYGYFVTKQLILWQVLLAHAISGLCGTFIENSFIASKAVNPDVNVGILLGLNEICWIIHESTTVIYSTIKLDVAVSSLFYKKVLRGILGSLFLAFAVCRINIGYLRVRDNTTGNPAIAAAHSYAFIFWGLADIVIFILLMTSIKQQLKVSNESTMALMFALLKSSIPRILILVVNTLIIVVIGQLASPTPGTQNLNALVWSIKGTYPIILLFDIHTTKDMLMQSKNKTKDASSHQKTTVQGKQVGDVKGH